MSSMRARGFTLMEILIVISILLIIIFLVMLNFGTQLKRANDVKRKTDLQKIQKAFEEYFNDAQCYPATGILQNCAGAELSPYIAKVPCDPVTKVPYLHVPGSPRLCSGYRVCTKLEDTKDPDITRIGCDPVSGCGFSPGYNYCVSAGYEPTSAGGGYEDFEGSYGFTPTPTQVPIFNGAYACRQDGQCNDVGDPQALGCPMSFAEPNCQGLCGDPWYRCP